MLFGVGSFGKQYGDTVFNLVVTESVSSQIFLNRDEPLVTCRKYT